MNNLTRIISTIIAMSLVFSVGIIVGKCIAADQMQKEAVQKGVGEWAIEYDANYENVHRVFRWKIKP